MDKRKAYAEEANFQARETDTLMERIILSSTKSSAQDPRLKGKCTNIRQTGGHRGLLRTALSCLGSLSKRYSKTPVMSAQPGPE